VPKVKEEVRAAKKLVLITVKALSLRHLIKSLCNLASAICIRIAPLLLKILAVD
jgi:hypothetical protein